MAFFLWGGGGAFYLELKVMFPIIKTCIQKNHFQFKGCIKISGKQNLACGPLVQNIYLRVQPQTNLYTPETQSSQTQDPSHRQSPQSWQQSKMLKTQVLIVEPQAMYQPWLLFRDINKQKVSHYPPMGLLIFFHHLLTWEV